MTDLHRQPPPPDVPDWPVTDDGIRDVFASLLRDGSWGRYHGPHCERLRADLSAAFAVEHVQLCSSGTAAIELCLRGAGVSPGDEVILAAYDYKANLINVLTVGGVPVLVDTRPSEPVIDEDRLTEVISDRTRAVIISHLHGSLSPMARLCAVLRPRGIAVIEDACQSPGAVVDDRPAGTWGDAGALSFGGSKLLTAGRGGAVLTHDAAFAQRMRLYTQRGNDAYPLSELQAAVLVPQLQQLPERNRLRGQRVERLRSQLTDSAVCRVVSAPETAASRPAFYKVAIAVPSCADREQLESLGRRMRAAGVAADPAFPALHLTHSARRFRAAGDLPHATRLHASLLTLHHPVLLQDAAAIERAGDVIHAAASEI